MHVCYVFDNWVLQYQALHSEILALVDCCCSNTLGLIRNFLLPVAFAYLGSRISSHSPQQRALSEANDGKYLVGYTHIRPLGSQMFRDHTH